MGTKNVRETMSYVTKENVFSKIARFLQISLNYD